MPEDTGPEPLKEILSRLFAARGWARRQARLHLERAWSSAVEPAHESHTRVLGLKRGILEVEVDSGVLMQELASFHKRQLLDKVRAALKGTTINDLRFKAGSWNRG